MWAKRSPGVIFTRTRASRSLAFHQSCHAPGSTTAVSPSRRMLVCPSRLTVSSPSRAVKRSTIAAWLCSPVTRAPTGAVSSAIVRPGGFVQGSSRSVARSRVDGILPNLADLDRREVGRSSRVGMRHQADAGCSEPGGRESGVSDWAWGPCQPGRTRCGDARL
jgi:hypothetical protein